MENQMDADRSVVNLAFAIISLTPISDKAAHSFRSVNSEQVHDTCDSPFGLKHLKLDVERALSRNQSMIPFAALRPCASDMQQHGFALLNLPFPAGFQQRSEGNSGGGIDVDPFKFIKQSGSFERFRIRGRQHVAAAFREDVKDATRRGVRRLQVRQHRSRDLTDAPPGVTSILVDKLPLSPFP